MNKLILTIACVALAGVVFAEDATAPAASGTNVVKKARLPKGARRNGGPIVIPDSQKGVIGIMSSQKKVALADYRTLMDDFADQYKYKVSYADCAAVTPATAKAEMRKAGVQIAVFLTECAECEETMVCAPESHWAIVNVAAVTKDARTPVYAAARTRKELLRAFMCAAGAMDSQFEGSMMCPIKSAKDLDKVIEDLPFDAIMRAANSMKSAGVTPLQTTTYKKACEEGWAPKPTTDYQQAIWDAVHAAPTAPIVIKPEAVQQK